MLSKLKLTAFCMHKMTETETVVLITTIAGDNHAQSQCMMQTQRVNDNHVLHLGASGSGTVYLELLQHLIETRKQHALTANNKPLTDKIFTESRFLIC